MTSKNCLILDNLHSIAYITIRLLRSFSAFIRKMAMESISNVQKTYRKINIAEQHSDVAYWQTQSYQVRLSTLEEIRQEYHRWKYGIEPRLQRVYTIVKR